MGRISQPLVLVFLLYSVLQSALCAHASLREKREPQDGPPDVQKSAEVVCTAQMDSGHLCTQMKQILEELEACRQDRANLTQQIAALQEKLRNETAEMDVDKEFEEWKTTHEKSYATPEEEAERKKIWLATRAMVIEHNKKHEQGLVTYTMGLNHFADLRPEEIPHGLRP